MGKIENEHLTIANKQELPGFLKDLPDKVARMRAKVYKVLGFAALAVLMLTSCVPEGQAQETRPAATQTIEDYQPSAEVTNDTEIATELASATPEVNQTLEATATPENTPTIVATATPEQTATPEATATPEEMTQAEIRAEILAAGVNLDDLANSADEWTRSHKAIETIQNYIDNLNFGRETEGSVTTVVIGLEAVENLAELDQALLTDGGWKLTTFAKLAYKDVNGDWQIIKVPLNAYHAEDDLFWMKNVSTRSAPFFVDGEKVIQPDENGNLILHLVNSWTSFSGGANYHSGVGSFIRLFTGWVENPRYANNDCVLGDPPRYSQEQLIEFRKTGDPSVFGYQDSDGYYIYWPLVTFNADLSALSAYNHD
jgi:hypothetical protein